MDIGIALPTMAPDYTRATTLEWSRGIDRGGFSSVSCGERITFSNQEMFVTLAAAAAVTERAKVFVNLAVAPLHAPAVLAKQIATLDVVSGGRVVVGLGVGGREHDYRAAGSGFDRRHQRLDDAVATLRSLWAGAVPFDGADPVGPPPYRTTGPELLAGAMGPKAMARAARWADGISGFSLGGVRAEFDAAVASAGRAWAEAGRDAPPRVVSGCFYVLGGDDDRAELAEFTRRYLAIFGAGFADAMAASVDVATPDRLREVVADATDAGVDELILVPGSTRLSCLEATVAALTD